MVRRPQRKKQDGVEIREVPIGALSQADWNPREITEERMESLKASIRNDPDFMWQRPILAMQDGTVYAGNQRLAACAALGWETVPAIMEDVTEQLAQERGIKDNANWGQWHDEALATMMSGMTEDSRSDLGFTDSEMVSILRQLPGQDTSMPADDDTGTYVNNESDRGKTPDEMIDNWKEGAIRNVVLYYQTDEHERVSGILEDIRDHLKTESNAEAVATALEDAYAHYCAGTEAPRSE